jgi:predicted RNase H-like nuclease (RuvC/YqgF family)
MKKSIFTFATAMFVTGTMLTGCYSDAEKVENAEQKLHEANSDVKDARQDLAETQQTVAISEFQQFKNESNEEINNNERRITELRIEMKTASKEDRKRDEKKIDALEKENHELKVRLEAYNDDGKSDWKKFKTEFRHDLDGIGQAFKDITVKNTK